MTEENEILSDFGINVEKELEEQVEREVELIPSRVDANWSDFLMSKLTDSELYYQHNQDGSKGMAYPKVAGLRRLTLAYLGLIINSGIKSFIPPSLSMVDGKLIQQYATIVYEVVVKQHSDGTSLTYSEIADAHPQFNLDKLVSGHPSPTAATRAEARALRKMLGLTVTSAEEIQGGGKDVAEMLNKTGNSEATDENRIHNDQINFINKLTKKLNIDVLKLTKGKKLELIDREQAQNICAELVSWNKNKNTPEEYLN